MGTKFPEDEKKTVDKKDEKGNEKIIKFIINKNYKVIKKLGSGGFGSVHLIDINDKSYALKVIKDIDKENINKCKEEANILSSLNSEYIVKYYDSCTINDNFYILMEYAGDFNLKAYIKSYKEKGQLIEEKIIEKIIKQICLGLKQIHNNRIIHRDLKPENIFINNENEIKIGDFGISKKLVSKVYANSKSGTLFYMAPEIIKNEKHNNKVDIYSLGCIVYELFTLNEYYIDKIIDGKEGKINLDIYNEKWQNLINLLIHKDYDERPDIDTIYNYIINATEKNEILLTLKIEQRDVGKKTDILGYGLNLEINELNTNIYINHKKKKSMKYFTPEKEGIYEIKLIFYFSIKDCSGMFNHCYSLQSVDFSSFNTKNVTNMANIFLCCCGLESINFSSFDTGNVSDMHNFFYGCYNLKSVDLSSYDTKNVKSMEYMFEGCRNLKTIDLSSFNTKNVISLSGMFSNCINLESINLSSSFDTGNVNNMHSLFNDCNNLISIDLSSIDTKNVTIMNNMFRGCNNLKTIDLSSFNTKNVISMSHMFSNCINLESINLSSSFDTKNVLDMSYMFFNCNNLKSLDLSPFDIRLVKDMCCIFCFCSNLKKINVSNKSLKKFINEKYRNIIISN